METKIYTRDTLVFKIVIPADDKNYSIEGITSITGDLPYSITAQFVKIENERIKIYCIGNNHSDYISLQSRIGYEVIAI